VLDVEQLPVEVGVFPAQSEQLCGEDSVR